MIKTKHLCERCDKPRHRDNKRFCSRECYYESAKVYRRCWVCEKKIHILMSRVEKGQGTFCSYKCRGKYKTQEKALFPRCPICHKLYKVKISAHKRGRGKYCSKECFNKSKYTGKNMPCDTCGKIHYRIKARIQKNNYCSYKCFRLA